MSKKDLWLNVDLLHGSSSGVTNDNPIINKPFEVPLYDPYTGEPNLEYEALTGKKNPLLDGNLLVPKSFEPKKENRFVFTFPSKFDIPSFLVCGVNLPTLEFVKKKRFWLFEETVKYWGDTSIMLYNSIAFDTNKKLLKIPEKEFICYVSLLDPTGVAVETWQLEGCSIDTIVQSDLSYFSDEIATIYVKIKTKNVILI